MNCRICVFLTFCHLAPWSPVAPCDHLSVNNNRVLHAVAARIYKLAMSPSGSGCPGKLGNPAIFLPKPLMPLQIWPSVRHNVGRWDGRPDVVERPIVSFPAGGT